MGFNGRREGEELLADPGKKGPCVLLPKGNGNDGVCLSGGSRTGWSMAGKGADEEWAESPKVKRDIQC